MSNNERRAIEKYVLEVFHYEHQTGTQQGSAIIQVVEFY